VLHRQTGEVVWLTSPALPLGFDHSHRYATVELPVVPGDRLYVLSDGLYEVPAPSGELWGPARLQRTISELGRRPLAEVIARTIESAAGWLGHERFPDDVAVMGFELEAESLHPLTDR
jgi:sigma-B regulation protein RsbU (phosphoserine phosphatase)